MRRGPQQQELFDPDNGWQAGKAKSLWEWAAKHPRRILERVHETLFCGRKAYMLFWRLREDTPTPQEPATLAQVYHASHPHFDAPPPPPEDPSVVELYPRMREDDDTLYPTLEKGGTDA